MLILADGTVIHGKGFGAPTETVGEVVFNTSLTGYEETLTDPSYAGQILTLTYPLIGNYGVRKDNFESEKIQVNGFIIRDKCDFPIHRDSIKDIDTFLKEHNVPGIYDIDTRYLTKKIRNHGVINGILAVGNNLDEIKLKRKLNEITDYSSINFLKKVSVKKPVYHDAKGTLKICLIDTGVKFSIIRNFLKKGINVWQMPYNVTPEAIEAKKPNGIFLANGPGDPNQAIHAIKVVEKLHTKYPISGICLGNQIISLAFGAQVYKLKFGHRGTNQPVKDLQSNKVFITSQNHGFAIDKESLKSTGLKVSHLNLNDNSVEGILHEKYKVRSVQFHPEANPGPHDVLNIFDDFIEDLKN